MAYIDVSTSLIPIADAAISVGVVGLAVLGVHTVSRLFKHLRSAIGSPAALPAPAVAVQFSGPTHEETAQHYALWESITGPSDQERESSRIADKLLDRGFDEATVGRMMAARDAAVSARDERLMVEKEISKGQDLPSFDVVESEDSQRQQADDFAAQFQSRVDVYEDAVARGETPAYARYSADRWEREYGAR